MEDKSFQNRTRSDTDLTGCNGTQVKLKLKDPPKG